MNDILVSVIVPVYNAEKYIEKCIKSILNQSYENFELLIVNDGSIDSTKSICEKYKKKDSRIILINKNNNGVSSARNDALKIAKGDYCCFVDADDYPDKDMIKLMVESAKKNKSDIVICEYNYIYENTNKKEEFKLKKYSNKDFLELISDESTEYGGFPWNKMIKRKCIKKNYRDELYYYENLIFFLENAKNIKSYSVVNKPLYNYLVNDTSALHSKMYSTRKLSNLDALHLAIDLVPSEYRDFYRFLYVRNYADNKFNIIKNKLDISLMSNYNDDFNSLSKDVLKSKNINFKMKMKCFIMKYFFFLYYLLKNFK